MNLLRRFYFMRFRAKAEMFSLYFFFFQIKISLSG